MKRQSDIGVEVSVECVGRLVEIAVGPTAVKMTPNEVDDMAQAMQQAAEEARMFHHPKETIH